MDSAAAFANSQDGRDEDVGTTELKAIDLCHHLSELAKARRFSPLKTFSKFMGVPGIISLAGGLPDPSYFPVETLGASVLAVDTFTSDEDDSSSSAAAGSGWVASWFGGSTSKGPSVQQVTVPKFVDRPTPQSLQLSKALQYGGADGLPFLQNWLREWTTILSLPAYDDWSVLIDDGATDGWHKVVELLCNSGDQVLVEAYAYPSAIEAGWPMGIRPVPIAIDHIGILPEALDRVLSEWNEETQGRRPRILYTVPVGQNPTGGTATKERKRKVYAVCVKHDIIICEDDPYYILQFTSAETSPASEANNNATKQISEANRRFISSLSPSYLTFDFQGRVIRLDTFSKTVAPGCRLGWITSNARFSERLLRTSETSTQQPSGFVQAVVGKILETWGMEGWIRWLRGLRTQYRERRDVTVKALHEGFKVEVQRDVARLTRHSFSDQCTRYVGYAKYNSAKRTPLRTVDLDEKFASFGLSEGRKPLISFVPPDAGMFVWITVYAANHKRFNPDAPASERRQMTRDLMSDLWTALATNNLLIAPGWMFAGDGLRSGAPDESKSLQTEALLKQAGVVSDEENGFGHFRLAFSFDSHDKLRQGVDIFAKTVTEFFE